MDMTQAVREWHEKFGVPIRPTPGFPGRDRASLRESLVTEEFEEFIAASQAQNILLVADALADLLYVIHGTALEWGIPIERVFKEVHRSNMSKVWDDGTVHFRSDGKVMKPPMYSPADIGSCL